MPTPKPIYLLDETLEVKVIYEAKDRDLVDNICLMINESCPEEEKLFKHDETHLYLTRVQALELAQAFLAAVVKSESRDE